MTQSYKIDGKEYASIDALADAFDVPVFLVERRLALGRTVEEAVGLIKRTKNVGLAKPFVVDGVRFPSRRAAAIHFGINFDAFNSRIERNWTPEQAVGLEPPPDKQGTAITITVDGIKFKSRADAAKHFGIRPDRFYSRLYAGWTPEEAAGLIPRGAEEDE